MTNKNPVKIIWQIDDVPIRIIDEDATQLQAQGYDVRMEYTAEAAWLIAERKW